MQLAAVGCGLDYWTGILDWTTGLKFFPFLDKIMWVFQIFDTWRPQLLFLETIEFYNNNIMTS